MDPLMNQQYPLQIWVWAADGRRVTCNVTLKQLSLELSVVFRKDTAGQEKFQSVTTQSPAQPTTCRSGLHELVGDGLQEHISTVCKDVLQTHKKPSVPAQMPSHYRAADGALLVFDIANECHAPAKSSELAFRLACL